jgi:hypothetical protein
LPTLQELSGGQGSPVGDYLALGLTPRPFGSDENG